MSKTVVGVIFGGVSSEHKVSLKSATAVLKNIPQELYDVHMIGITKQGKWFLFSGDVDDIVDSKWESSSSNQEIFIATDPEIHGIVFKNSFKTIRMDVIIPVLHGKNGEDGTIQGLLEISGIPYVGCKVLGAAACMDKIFTNIMLSSSGIPKAKFHWFRKYDFEVDPKKCISDTEDKVGRYPMFVKPANAGSSVGITKVKNHEELIAGVEKALKEDWRVLIEEEIVGKEVECAVLGNDDPITSVVGEIVPSNDFYDYDAKYLSGTSDLIIPANISDEAAKKVADTAREAYRIMDCRGLSRVDFFVDDKTNRVFLNEINTFPGFTPISMYPRLMEKLGIRFGELLERIISLALEKQ